MPWATSGAISEPDLQHIDSAAPRTQAPRSSAKLGVESAYEKQLHGANGYREILVQLRSAARCSVKRRDA